MSSVKKIKIVEVLTIFIFGLLPPLLIYLSHSDSFVFECESILKRAGFELSSERLRVGSFVMGTLLLSLFGPIKVVWYRNSRDKARLAVQSARQELLETFRIAWKGSLQTGQDVDFAILVPRNGFLGWWDKYFHSRRMLVSLPDVNTAKRMDRRLEYRVDWSRKSKCNNQCRNGVACANNCFEGVVGLSYYKGLFVFADGHQLSLYRLTEVQSQIVHDVRFVAALPIFDKNNNAIAVLSVYSKEELGAAKESEVSEFLLQMQKVIYHVVPLSQKSDV